jgi:hypothetical protein
VLGALNKCPLKESGRKAQPHCGHSGGRGRSRHKSILERKRFLMENRRDYYAQVQTAKFSWENLWVKWRVVKKFYYSGEINLPLSKNWELTTISYINLKDLQVALFQW